LVAGLFIAGGCSSAYGGSLWILPPDEPPPVRPPVVPEPAAALGLLSLEGEQDVSQGGPLRLRDVLDSVVRSYPLLTVAEQKRVIAQARQLAALGNFDLELKGFATADALGFYQNETAGLFAEQPTGLWGATFYGGYRIGNGEFDPTYDGDRLTNDGGEFSAGVRVPMLRGGSIDDRRRELWGAEIERDIADQEAAATRLEIALAASEAYWRWVAAGRGLQVARELLALAEERQTGIEIRVRRGDLPEVEQIDNERLVVGRRALLIAAQRAVERTAIALSLFVRNEDGDPVVPQESSLPTEFPAGSEPLAELLDDDIVRALMQRPEIQRLARLRDRFRVDRDFFENTALPRLDLRVEGSQDLDDSSPTPTKGEFELFVGLEMSLNVQNRRAHGRILELDSRLRQLSEETRIERDQIAAEVQNDFSELVATFGRTQQSRRAAELADRVADGERRRFDLGDSTVLVLNLREEAAAEARLRLIEALRDYWIAVAQYRAAVGEDPTLTFG
jgi:outer membrane protein TolC